MFKQRFSTKILSWSAGNLNLQIGCALRKKVIFSSRGVGGSGSGNQI